MDGTHEKTLPRDELRKFKNISNWKRELIAGDRED